MTTVERIVNVAIIAFLLWEQYRIKLRLISLEHAKRKREISPE